MKTRALLFSVALAFATPMASWAQQEPAIGQAEMILLSRPPGNVPGYPDMGFQMSVSCPEKLHGRPTETVLVEFFQLQVNKPVLNLGVFSAKQMVLSQGNYQISGDDFSVYVEREKADSSAPRSFPVKFPNGKIPGSKIAVEVFSRAIELNPSMPDYDHAGPLRTKLVECP